MHIDETLIREDHARDFVQAARDHRQKLIAEDQQAASLDRTNTRVPQPPYRIPELDDDEVMENGIVYITEAKGEIDWIVERAQALGLPGMPEGLSTAVSCTGGCDGDCLKDHVLDQLTEAAEQYRTARDATFRNAIRLAEEALARTPQGEAISYEAVQEVGGEG